MASETFSHACHTLKRAEKFVSENITPQGLIQDFVMGEARTKMEGIFAARASSQDAKQGGYIFAPKLRALCPQPGVFLWCPP